MTTKKLLWIAGIALAIFQSCGDGFKTSENGLKYKIHTKSEGKKIQEGDYVMLQMIYRTDSDSVLFDTHKMGQAVRLIVSPSTFRGDLMDGLKLLAEKDSATFLIHADSLFSKTFQVPRPPFIREGSFLTFDVKVEKVTSKEKMEEEMKAESEKQAKLEKQNIDKYISDKKLKTTATGTGLQYMVTKQGVGDKPSENDTVVVNYEGRLLNGNKFDSSYDTKRPLKFPVGQGQVIKGWEEAFLLLNKGAKATLIVPSHLGYGPNAVGNGTIPAYSTLVFDVELVDIIKATRK